MRQSPRRNVEEEARELELLCWFRPHYSAIESETFWKQVKSSKNRMLYDFACILQDVESRVLNLVNDDVSGQIRERLRKQKRRGAKRRK